MATVRELITMLIMNASLDDQVEIEIRDTDGSGDIESYAIRKPARVSRINTNRVALIECYDDNPK